MNQEWVAEEHVPGAAGSQGRGTVGARIGPDDTAAALAEPGVRLFDMTGRPMRGWVLVAGEVLDDDVLERWIGQARSYVGTRPPK